MSIYSLEILLTISASYLGLVSIWKPYYEEINFHNYVIIFNQYSDLIGIRVGVGSGSTIFTILLYLVMFLLGLVMGLGFVRLVKERFYRRDLEDGKIGKRVVKGDDK
jgi:hypothetical protein